MTYIYEIYIYICIYAHINHIYLSMSYMCTIDIQGDIYTH